MRKERLEEHKKPKGAQAGNNQNGDEMPAEIHQASTVYHGVGGDQSGKGWLEPPGYLR